MTLDDRLDEQFKRMDGTTVLPIYNRPTAIGQAKEAILSDLLEIIGEVKPDIDKKMVDDYRRVFGDQSREYIELYTLDLANEIRKLYHKEIKEYCK